MLEQFAAPRLWSKGVGALTWGYSTQVVAFHFLLQSLGERGVYVSMHAGAQSLQKLLGKARS